MSTTDESLHAQTDDQRAATLFRLLRPVIGKPKSRSRMQFIDAQVKRYTEHLWAHGVDFPQLTAVWLDNRGHLELVRRDLEPVGIQQVVRNLITRFPDITGDELVPAIRQAFPDYKGGM